MEYLSSKSNKGQSDVKNSKQFFGGGVGMHDTFGVHLGFLKGFFFINPV